MEKKPFTPEQKAKWIASQLDEIQRAKRLLDRIEKFYRKILAGLPVKKQDAAQERG